MPLTILKTRLGRRAEVEDIDLDKKPSTVITTNPTTPLVEMGFPDEESTHKKSDLRSRLRRLWQCRMNLYHPEPRRRVAYRLVVFIPLLCLVAFMLVILYFTAVSSILHALQPPLPNNGVQMIVDTWSGPGSADLGSIDQYSFSASVTPIPCHSHNDYTRRVPLFEALSMGCISVEADVYVPPDSTKAKDLLVGHKRPGPSTSHTICTLYLEPLLAILNAMNPGPADLLSLSGPYITNSTTPLTLLIDLKERQSDSIIQTLSILNTILTPLRDARYLTTHDPTTNTLHRGPLTIVLSGSATLAHITNSTLNPHHDLFLDAPLHALFRNNDDDADSPTEDGSGSMSPYNTTNSAMASTSLPCTTNGGPSLLTRGGRFSTSQTELIQQQLAQARHLGLPSRYWATPEWPVGRRGRVWRQLLEWGVGLVNVDELAAFARWDWEGERVLGWCWVVGGVLGRGLCR